MQVSSTRATRTGLRMDDPASEGFVFGAELEARKSQASAPRDSFMFMVDGRPAVLPVDWGTIQNWENVKVVGAVAPMLGSQSSLAQSGWFYPIVWRWIHITAIEQVTIRSDKRFRGGLENLGDIGTVPQVSRLPLLGSPPAWWGCNAEQAWSDAKAAMLEQAPVISGTDHDQKPSGPARAPRRLHRFMIQHNVCWDMRSDAAPEPSDAASTTKGKSAVKDSVKDSSEGSRKRARKA
ncbi:hypothetical protein FRC07_009572 [Ceratobasidium sp. 392]|nr:hypothetical protein FRC07_009572 [Ceratobasidium sp. 392]